MKNDPDALTSEPFRVFFELERSQYKRADCRCQAAIAERLFLSEFLSKDPWHVKSHVSKTSPSRDIGASPYRLGFIPKPHPQSCSPLKYARHREIPLIS